MTPHLEHAIGLLLRHARFRGLSPATPADQPRARAVLYRVSWQDAEGRVRSEEGTLEYTVPLALDRCQCADLAVEARRRKP